MASGTAVPPPQQNNAAPRQPSARYESLIDDRLRRTRRQVKGVDVAAGLMTLSAGTLAYLLAAAMIDHWLVAGGLGFGGRVLLLAGLVSAAGYHFSRWVLPPLIHRINPVFAAQTIEQTRPSLKNSLINFLLIRRERQAVPPVIYEALEHRAAADLSQVRIETAVDRARIVRWACVLAAVVAVVCLYLALSPKNPLVSFGRIIWPWADLQAPTRVTISRVEPGDLTTFHGEFATVSAEVTGLNRQEPVTLFYTTADGQSVDQAIPMTVPQGGYRHRCVLPPGSRGLQQDVQYYLAAGDCRTQQFKITAQINPTIVVERVDYHYPTYTGIPDRTVEREGDLRAIEGTRVLIRATANQEIARAEIDLDCNGLHRLKMTANGTEAAGQFTLRLKPDDPQRPEHDSYQLRFSDRSGHENRRPIRYRIEVIRDLPPEIQLTQPQEDDVQLPENGQLEIRLRAADPDFGLRRVVLRAEREGRSLPIPPLLSKPQPEQPWKGEFEAAYRFEPSRLELKAGDHVSYWGEAEDNKADDDKQVLPNHSETRKRSITIVGPQKEQPAPQRPDAAKQQPRQPADNARDQPPDQPKQPPQDQQPQPEQAQQPAGQQPAKDGQRPQKDQPETQDQNKSDQAQEGGQDEASKSGDGRARPNSAKASQKQEKPSAEKSDQNRTPIDDQTNPGDAFEEILQHRQEKQDQPAQADQKQQRGDQQHSAGKQQQRPAEDQRQAGDQQQAGGQKQQTPAQQQQQGDQRQKTAGQQPGAQGDQKQQTASQQQQQQEQPTQGDQQTRTAGQQKQSAGDQKQSAGDQQQLGSDQRQFAGDQKQQPAGQQQPQTAQKQQPEADQQQPADGQKQQRQDQQGQPPPGQQLAQGEQAQPKTAGDKASKSEGDQQRTVDRDQAAGEKSGAKQQPQPGKGFEGQGPGDRDQQKPASEKGQEKPEAKGGDRETGQGPAGAGKPSNENIGSPSPQEANKPRDKKPGEADPAKPDRGESADSPSTSPKDSDSKGDTSGDRSGGGEKGGGQKSDQPGVGTGGTHTAAEQGGSQADQKGAGETGTRGGEQVKADRPTGKSAVQKGGPGSGGQQSPGQNPAGEQAKDSSPSGGPTSPTNRPDGGQPGQPGQSASDGFGRRGQGNPTAGGQPGEQPAAVAPPEAKEPGGDEPNRLYANKQTDLALEYLKDQLAKEQPDPDLLKRLGWAREDLERFYQRWAQMKRAAAEAGPQSDVARKDLHDALRSLGLRPHATQLRGGQSQPDQIRDLRGFRRIAPPANWAEQLRAYTEGVAGGK